MKHFILEPPKLWGDFGSVLIAGYYRRENCGPMLLHRTGPFAPPVFIPWSSVGGPQMVVTNQLFDQLQELVPDLSIRPAVGDRIVGLSWHTWDLAASQPAEYPPEGEPEGYIWDRAHEPDVAAAMDAMSELLMPVVDCTYREVDPDDPDSKMDVVVPDAKLPLWFRTRAEWGDFIVAEPIYGWLRQNVQQWLTFKPFDYKIA